MRGLSRGPHSKRRATSPFLCGVAVAIIVAGCSSGTDPIGPGPGPPGPGDDPEWSAPVTLGTSAGRLAAGDVLHFVSKVSGSSTLHHRKSGDHGGTWSAASALATSGSPPLYRSFVAVGQRLYLLTTESNGHLYLRSSSNSGDTWGSATQVSGSELEKPHRIAMAVSGNFVHVVNTREFNAGGDRQVFYWRSSNGGADFESAVVLDDDSHGPVNASVAAEGGIVHVVYERFDEGPQVYYMRSANNGVSWTAPVRLSDPAAGNALRARVEAVDGRVIVSWQQDIPGSTLTQRIGIRRSMNAGAEWEAVRFATPPGRQFNHQVIVARPGGSVHILCIDGAPGTAGATAQYVGSSDYGATWTEPETVATQAGNGVSQPFELAGDGEYLHVVLGPTPAVYLRRSNTP